MFRPLVLFCLLAAPALAEWSPTPRAFSYDASFARCTADPARVDIDECADILRGAFDLNRAVAQAVQGCDGATVADCPDSFEILGLPAIAARIAVDAKCDATGTGRFDPQRPLPADHCITTIADILRDEGVVPFIEPPSCEGEYSECAILRDVHATLWLQAVNALSDTPMTAMRLEESRENCDATGTGVQAIEECHIAALADIWADLAQNGMRDN